MKYLINCILNYSYILRYAYNYDVQDFISSKKKAYLKPSENKWKPTTSWYMYKSE